MPPDGEAVLSGSTKLDWQRGLKAGNDTTGAALTVSVKLMLLLQPSAAV